MSSLFIVHLEKIEILHLFVVGKKISIPNASVECFLFFPTSAHVKPSSVLCLSFSDKHLKPD